MMRKLFQNQKYSFMESGHSMSSLSPSRVCPCHVSYLTVFDLVRILEIWTQFSFLFVAQRILVADPIFLPGQRKMIIITVEKSGFVSEKLWEGSSNFLLLVGHSFHWPWKQWRKANRAGTRPSRLFLTSWWTNWRNACSGKKVPGDKLTPIYLSGSSSAVSRSTQINQVS